MYRNVMIKSIGRYLPEKIIDNNFYIDHFNQADPKLGQEAKEYFKELGRDKRVVANKNEDMLDMATKACEAALNNAGLTVDDIDIIISATNCPEYLTPCCAIMIHERLKGTNNQVVAFDLNVDCISMLVGVDTATKFLKCDKKYKRALVVGSYLWNRYATDDNIITFATNGDASSAMVLEVKEEQNSRGYLGSTTLTDSAYSQFFRFPKCGMSNVIDNTIDEYDKKLYWKNFNCDFLPGNWAKIITDVLDEQNLQPKNVTHFFMSQFSKEENEWTMDKLGVPRDKFLFVGDKYGYTGPSSPFMAFEDQIKIQNFNKDDIAIFCSVGAGYSMTALLYRW